MNTSRAYAVIDLKGIDEDKREFFGIASTPTPDRYQDIVEPLGAKFTLPLPLLWQHDSGQPIGHVVKANVLASGIEVAMRLAKVDEPGLLRDRLDLAWQAIKSRLVRGLSIGFRGLETSRLPDTGGVRFVKWEWLELSAVTIPANADATITAVKRLDREQRAARDGVRIASGRNPDGSVRLLGR